MHKAQFIDQVQAFLEYQKEVGIQTLEISPETLDKLRSDPVQKAVSSKRAVSASHKHEVSPPKPEKISTQLAGETLEEIAEQILHCKSCALHTSRKNTVPGEGASNRPDLLFIGEGPGADEDVQGRPFVGVAGQLLDKMIAAMGYKREEVFIANIVKCRPPGNRVPSPEEMIACTPYLKAQIALIRPQVIVALGKTAVEGLLHERVAITRMRGTWKSYEGIDLMPTFHPAYLLRSPSKKREVWDDLQAVLAKLGKEVPPKK